MSGWLGTIGTNSVAVAAATSSGDGCSQHGHNDGVVSQSGPCCHSFEAISS